MGWEVEGGWSRGDGGQGGGGAGMSVGLGNGRVGGMDGHRGHDGFLMARLHTVIVVVAITLLILLVMHPA